MKHLALLCLALAACSKAPAQKSGTLTPVDLPGHPTVPVLPDPDLNNGHVGRAPRRITVAQLKQSIQITTGRQWSQIDTLAASLGQADFAVTVSDSTEANLVFAKFLEDGAREVCLNAAKDDLARSGASTRMLWPELPAGVKDFTTVDDATIQKNLGTLATRFWGSSLDASELPAWTSAFKKMAAQAKLINKPEQGWAGVCIAMMVDPRFITY